MKPKINPENFAKILFDISEKNNVANEVKNALLNMNNMVAKNGQFRVFIQSKKINGQTKTEILNKILAGSSHPLANEIVSYLSGSGAISDLRNITFSFESLFKKKRNILDVEGVVAHQIPDQQIQSLKASLDEILGKKTTLSIKVDTRLIGGIRLRIENTFLDASIQNQLQTLHNELLQI